MYEVVNHAIERHWIIKKQCVSILVEPLKSNFVGKLCLQKIRTWQQCWLIREELGAIDLGERFGEIAEGRYWRMSASNPKQTIRAKSGRDFG
ncbi:hypothetical protein GCM10007901_09190 [Dyella acidisoli]|uniref:Uncharacterized protein n=1 Tax=Dyella acidisoli TaxID=1867834 RepID=A0ABQ5XK15_9GAMM|nr:hypothetical protein GCM10007901_09190 [Dyella acidisoli]